MLLLKSEGVIGVVGLARGRGGVTKSSVAVSESAWCYLGELEECLAKLELICWAQLQRALLHIPCLSHVVLVVSVNKDVQLAIHLIQELVRQLQSMQGNVKMDVQHWRRCVGVCNQWH